MKIGVIMGGISSEREVSLNSGNSIVENIDKNKYEVLPIIIDKKEDIIEKVKGIDFALLALHGKFGEDGTVQSVLQTLGIPYSGCGPLSSALCMDKDLTKRILQANNIRTARWLNVSNVDEIDYDKIEEMKYPVFIKPTNGGSSVATFKITKKEDVEEAVREGLKWDNEVMIEEFIKGEEITCPVFKNEMFPIIAIRPKTDFFDYTQKYSGDGADEIIIELEEKLHNEVEQMALDTYKALKCSVYSRIDMIITEEGVPYILEVNTLPGMTKTSLFPKSAAAKGFNFTQFIDMIIENSIKENR
ncbi:D-alanine--D-alanine ligase [Clostridium chauvoei]|uniref:D-alanine--D-alanine ligase n=2 Tax=Clostridium chauvoei TaxID=46867 RepID=A0A1U6JN35_9CLOT|nr:D-alanine--D-alanine ligase [Clostridium chauvoei]ATD55808.1 D-alanine--D-alanine ligase [Clostridium chauvoei]ATD56518.1 D-alanine--D-alanine ligase [Clostridium chauvoei]MBX7280166.1 D-alanine--D-alanine ligase [Clostridium chauvoei]MBX7282724.1 D-alanine--D-alanine ligase [Clostridium chauvoei]MBX7285057.1 D-alanine--D-alanine ligase [Clostridium chauvoei]